MKVAFLAFNDCALWQVSLLMMLLKRNGDTIKTLTPGGTDVVSDGGLTIRANQAIETDSPRDFDLVLMAGGNYPQQLCEDTRVHRFLRQYSGTNRLIAASCASSLMLAAAGLIQGLKFTSMPHIVNENKPLFDHAHFTDEDVCFDGNIITSKGHAHYEWMMLVFDALGLTTADPNLTSIAAKLSRNL